MGEAKNRKKQFKSWIDGLSNEERTIVSVSLAAHDNFVVPRHATGMCYRLAIFLSSYLKERHNIEAQAIVGYVNDGLGDIMTSHAWIEYNNKKTDISLTITERPDAVPTGALIILDEEFFTGDVSYTYHHQQTEAGQQVEHELFQEVAYKELVLRKRDEHAMMQSIAKDYATQRSYLDSAPDGLNYRKIAAIVEGQTNAEWLGQ